MGPSSGGRDSGSTIGAGVGSTSRLDGNTTFRPPCPWAAWDGKEAGFAAVAGPASGNEGDNLDFNAAASVDPNGAVVSFAWDFGDGTTASGVNASHVFAQDGVHAVTVTVTDTDGLTDTATLFVTVSNVAPVLGNIPDGTLQAGDTYTVTGQFSDPGADAWIVMVNWGDGSAPSQALVSGHDFSLVHVYENPGSYLVSVAVADDDTSAAATHAVTVTGAASSMDLTPALGLIDQLVAARKISRDVGSLMKSQVRVAQELVNQDKRYAARVLLNAVVVQVDLLVRFRQITAADAAPLRNFLQLAIAELSRR